MSPELIAPQRFGFKNSRPTKPSDCYALGMVIYETISGNFPFHRHTDPTVIMKVLEGEHPPRGAGFTRSLWEMLELCWTPQPGARPSIEDVLQCLEMVSDSLEPPGMEEEVEEGGDDWDSDSGSPSVPNRTGDTDHVLDRPAGAPPLIDEIDSELIRIPNKEERKPGDANQLRVLNEVYARTFFPSIEERQRLAEQLDMTPRGVQIWYASHFLHHRPHLTFPFRFQNKRESMRNIHRQSARGPGSDNPPGAHYNVASRSAPN